MDFYKDKVEADRFLKLYTYDADFKERFSIWTSLIDKHSLGRKTGLDMGCGPGIFSRYMAQKGLRVTGIDASQAMIDLCTSHKDNSSSLSFIKAEIPLNELTAKSLEPVDLIISSSVLEYVGELKTALAQFHGLLASDGVLIVSLPNRASIFRKLQRLCFSIFGRPRYMTYVKNQFTIESFENLLKSTGFSMKEFHYYAHNQLISRLCRFLPLRFSENLFVAVFKKNPLVSTANQKQV